MGQGNEKEEQKWQQIQSRKTNALAATEILLTSVFNNNFDGLYGEIETEPKIEEIESDVEFGMIGEDQLQFPADMKLLKLPDIWIGDNGALGHCTAHSVGGINVWEGITTTTGISGEVIKPKRLISPASIVINMEHSYES